ncbi:hypothetical protein KEM56_000385 [Ascosphaera pollenicola]|nr:hypothetical protein KEM56_000385 [Ascosphaera pollenicola]
MRHEWASSESESDYIPQSDESDDGHVTTPHEERADAFDYEHFVLHSAMAQYADSETSFTETEDSGEIEEEQADEHDVEGEVAEDESDDPQHEVDPNGDSDNDSVKTAKNVGGQDNSPVSRRSSSKYSERQTQPPTAESKLLAPIAKSSLSSKESLESLSTVLTFETATEGRSSREDLSETLGELRPGLASGSYTELCIMAAHEQSTQHKRDASDKTVTIQNPEKGFSSSASLKYKISSIRNADSPTVLIQPRSFENRASSRASSRKSRSRVSNATAYVQTIDPPSPAYQSPHLKVVPTPLRIHTETDSLRSSSSARTADSGTSASVSSVTAPAAAAPAQASASNSHPHSPRRNTLGSPLSLRKHSIADSQTSSPGSPLPDLQEVVASLISTAANRFAPASVMANTALSPEQGDSAHPSHMGSPLTQMQDQDLARLSALFTSVGQLAFRLQLSLANQEKQLPALPEHSPSQSVRATHVLRERLEAAKRILDGKLEIPPIPKMR